MVRLDFAWFKASDPARDMFRKLGLEEHLKAASSWRVLRALIVRFNGCDRGDFVKLVRQCDGVCSSGERVLLHAIASVCDFAWLADELTTELSASAPTDNPTYGVYGAWQRMNRASGDHLRCVAACILAADQT